MNYKNGRWAAKREAVLSRDKFRCRECQRYGIPMDASVVHHAYPADDFPEYAWCDWNLVSLCPGCHNAMHDRESGALTAKGMAWMRRVSPPLLRQKPKPLGDRRGQGRFRRRGKRLRGFSSSREEEHVHDAPANDAGA